MSSTVGAVWDGRAGSDWLNRLVVAGGLSWQQVSVLRAYREYRQVLGATFTSRYQNDCFVRNAPIARKLVQLFETRFDPAGDGDDEAEQALVDEISADLDAVTSLDDDRILRGYLGMIQATVRTNAYVHEGRSAHLSFKVRCQRRAQHAAAGAAVGDLRLLARRWPACTCAAAWSPAAASAGRTGSRTTAPRCSA